MVGRFCTAFRIKWSCIRLYLHSASKQTFIVYQFEACLCLYLYISIHTTHMLYIYHTYIFCGDYLVGYFGISSGGTIKMEWNWLHWTPRCWDGVFFVCGSTVRTKCTVVSLMAGIKRCCIYKYIRPTPDNRSVIGDGSLACACRKRKITIPLGEHAQTAQFNSRSRLFTHTYIATLAASIGRYWPRSARWTKSNNQQTENKTAEPRSSRWSSTRDGR